MSTITKERLKELAAGQSGFNLRIATPEESMELARIALASLEAEPVCVIDQSNLDYLKSGSDADVWPASRTEMGDVLLYRAAPPAPVSVPEWTNKQCLEFLSIAFRHAEINGDLQLDDIRLGVKMVNGSRATMLQGAEPVTTDYKLRDAVEIIRNSGIEIDAEKIFAERDALNTPDCWCRTCRPVTVTDMRFVVCLDCGNKRCPHANDQRNACTGSNEPGQEGSAYPAAPQQEVKP